jgi:mRNA-degrading endonuclease RelE of RelBE toxin-antitoxin system
MPEPAWAILFAAEVNQHLDSLSRSQEVQVLAAIRSQLSHQPMVQTRNRKRMKPNPLSGWELRVGDLRVYYDADEAKRDVMINAIGVKRHNRLFIGGEEYEL